MRRVVALVVAVGVILLLGAAPAWAHSKLDASNPADGADVATPPASVSLTFDEDVQAGFTVMTLIGPDGKDYHSGSVTETDETVTVNALPLGPAGVYQIGYRVVSADGHPVSGKTSFTLTVAGPGSPPGPGASSRLGADWGAHRGSGGRGRCAGVAVDRRCRRARGGRRGAGAAPRPRVVTGGPGSQARPERLRRPRVRLAGAADSARRAPALQGQPGPRPTCPNSRGG